MKIDFIVLREHNKPEFPLDLLRVRGNEEDKQPIMFTPQGIRKAVMSKGLGGDLASCYMYEKHKVNNEAVSLGLFLFEILKDHPRIEEVIFVYNHDKTKFGIFAV